MTIFYQASCFFQAGIFMPDLLIPSLVVGGWAFILLFCLSRLFFFGIFFSVASFFFRVFLLWFDHFEHLELIIDSCASPSDNFISLSYSMPAFSANSFGLFIVCTIACQFNQKTVCRVGQMGIRSSILFFFIGSGT